jgi:hypothetical protein
MTTTTATEHDNRPVVRALWALYLGCLVLVAACFVGLAVTGRATFLVAGLLGCACGWIVTGPLEDARREARTIAQGKP